MILNIIPEGGFSIIKILHSFISVTFLVLAIWLFIRSLNGIIKEKVYTRLDKLLSFGFIISLYLQLVFGLVLFSNLGSNMGFNDLNAEKSMMIVSKRLWPIEHIVLMIFALLIANLGLIISINTKSDRGKHLNILIYYSVSLLMIIYSLSAIYFL